MTLAHVTSLKPIPHFAAGSSALLLLAACALFTGCGMSRNITTVKHADGSGTTHYRYIAAGGFFRPGVIVVVSETVGSNAPVVLTQASGAPMAPGLMGTPASIAEAALIGRGLAKSGNETTVIKDDPAPPPIEPPRPPGNWDRDKRNKGR